MPSLELGPGAPIGDDTTQLPLSAGQEALIKIVAQRRPAPSELDDNTLAPGTVLGPKRFPEYPDELLKDPDRQRELDPQLELWDSCKKYEQRMQTLYGDDPRYTDEFSHQFLNAVYSGDLSYVERGLGLVQKLLDLNNGHIEELHMLNDIDRSNAAVAILNDFQTHVPRAAWGYFIKMVDKRLPNTKVRIGILSDRPQEFDDTQKTTQSGEGLIDMARALLAHADIDADKYLDPNLVISCSDSPLATNLPSSLRGGMRIPRDQLEEYRGLSELDRKIFDFNREFKQFEYIGDIISDTEIILDPDIEYHPKVGIPAAYMKTARPGVRCMVIDDVNSVSLIDSPLAMGFYVDEKIQPLLPDTIWVPDLALPSVKKKAEEEEARKNKGLHLLKLLGY